MSGPTSCFIFKINLFTSTITFTLKALAATVTVCLIQSLISTEELQSLHLDGRRKLFQLTHERTFKQTSNRAAFLFNITISTVATQNILIWTGLDLEHQNVILNVNVTQHATDSLASVNYWPINYGSWWGCQPDRWVHLSNRHMAALLCGLFRDYDQVKRFS